MLKFIKRVSEKTGLPPGTLTHVGEKKAERVRIRIIDYDEERIEERDLGKIDECLSYKDKPTVTWINIDGLHEVDIIQKIGEVFRLHPLALEDIANTAQRPKIDDFEDYLVIISNMLFFDDEENQIREEQFSLVLGPNYVISFQERTFRNVLRFASR